MDGDSNGHATWEGFGGSDSADIERILAGVRDDRSEGNGNGHGAWTSQGGGDHGAEIQKILGAGREEAERVLRDAEHRVSALIQGMAARASESLQGVLGELREVLVALEAEQQAMTERLDSARRAIEYCRTEVEAARSQLGGGLAMKGSEDRPYKPAEVTGYVA